MVSDSPLAMLFKERYGLLCIPFDGMEFMDCMDLMDNMDLFIFG